MRRLAVASVCLALGWLVVQVPLERAYAQSKKVTRIGMTIGELRAQGIAVSPNAQPFPNSCQSVGNTRLSVSDELLAHFKTRGFTLESVALGSVRTCDSIPRQVGNSRLLLYPKSAPTDLTMSFLSTFHFASATASLTWNAISNSIRGGQA
jgi:hypothetical protein